MWRFSAISVLSAGSLAYEILLMRLFSIVQWHHFAYMIISLALLGFGAAGAVIAIERRRLLARFGAVFTGAAVLFAITAPLGFILAAAVPFNPLELLWDRVQPLYLLAIYVLLAVPFFFAATAIGLALTRYGDVAGVVYRFDLIGAGLGAVASVALLFAVPPQATVFAVAAAGFLAAALSAGAEGRGRGFTAALLALAVIAGLAGSIAPPVPLSPYKALAGALRQPGAAVLAERSSPLGQLSLVDPGVVPLRYAPGLSLLATAPVPAQRAIYLDGDSLIPVVAPGKDAERTAYMTFQAHALPYRLRHRARVLILGAGAGADVLMALRHEARSVDAVEINPAVPALAASLGEGYSADVWRPDKVRLVIADARGFVANTDRRYDIIQIALLDSFATAAAGLHALSESTVYTVEAFDELVDRLAPDGLLSITRWLNLPPRGGLKMFATAVAALKRRGVERPGERLALIRSWNTVTLLVKNGAIAGADAAAIEEFAAALGFDVAYLPGLPRSASNRFNRLAEPYFYDGATALLGPDAEAFFEDYKYNVRPASDDRPYFFHFLKWRTVPELFSLERAAAPFLIEWGYVVLIAALLQAALVSAVLVPLAFMRERRGPSARRPRGWVVGYFFLIGFAFLFIEIAFIYRLVLFLHHPIYASAVVLSAFLIFAGIGSGYAERVGRWTATRPFRSPVLAVVVGIVVAAAWLLGPAEALFAALSGQPLAIKAAVAVIALAPLAFFMGLPFPLAVRALAEAGGGEIPLAWAANGCASVIGAILATLLAIHFGFTAVIVTALLLYGLAIAAFPAAPAQGVGASAARPR